MAYMNYQQASGSDTQTAVDWEAKRVPLMAYQECLLLKHRLEVCIAGTKREDPVAITHDFVAAVSMFYNTVEVHFIKYLNNQAKEKPVLYGAKQFTEQDYDFIVTSSIGITIQNYDKCAARAFAMFKLLKNWCFEFGNFRTLDVSYTPDEAFQYG